MFIARPDITVMVARVLNTFLDLCVFRPVASMENSVNNHLAMNSHQSSVRNVELSLLIFTRPSMRCAAG